MDPAWSPDGSQIVFARVHTGAGLHVMNADGSNIRRLTSPNNPALCTTGTSANDLKPDWSPDGQRIVFERDIHTSEDGGFDCALDGWGYVPNVYVMNADGTGVRRLRSLDWWIDDMDPAWSPDGQFIAFATHFRGMYIVDKDAAYAAEPVVVALPGLGLDPVWSPDGKKLLVLSAIPPTNSLIMVDIATGKTQGLSFPTVPGLLLGPAWSR
jgi:TolB protein